MMSDGSALSAADWERIAQLASVTIEATDLDVVELLQRGMVGPQLILTEEASAELGTASPFVVRDVEGVPLVVGSRQGSVVTTKTLRPVDAVPTSATRADLAVVVKGTPSQKDLARIEVLTHSDMRVSWIVLAARTRSGRELVAQIAGIAKAQARAEHTVMRLPWPGAESGRIFRIPRLPDPAEISAACGARHHVIVGDDASGPQGRSDRGGTVVFFTGLSGSGKSTVAKALHDSIELRSERAVNLLDGDDVRRMLSWGLGFDEAGRTANVRRVSWVAALLAGSGGIAITALIAPFAQMRAEARKMAVEAGADFLEVWVSTPLEECERRDRKGLYALARAGQIPDFTGIDSPYQAPTNADLVIDTRQFTVSESAELVFAELEARAIRRGTQGLARTAGRHIYQGPTYDI